MRFEGWYLKQHFAKRKGLSIGLLLVILSVTLISASPTLAYFHIYDRETNSAKLQSALVRVYFPQPLNQSGFSGVQETPGVQEVIPTVWQRATISVDGRSVSEYVYFTSSSNAPGLLGLFGLDTKTLPAPHDWLIFGYVAAKNDGIPVGKSIQVNASGIGGMTATGSGTTFSDSDFLVFGDIQSYWVGNGQASVDEYNSLIIVAANSSVVNSLGERIAAAHGGWQVTTPAQLSGAIGSTLSGQLTFTLSLSVVSWTFGIVVFVTYVAREVSSRSKELVTLGALGASRGTLTRCVSYYLLTLTSIGGVIGLFLSVAVLMPEVEILSFGYPLIESPSTIVNTSLTVLAPILALDVLIVIILQFRLSRLDMMSFLRSEV